MRNVKSIVLAALALTVIAALAVAALAGTHLLTKDSIAENERLATQAACRLAFPMPEGETYSYEPLAEDVSSDDGVLAVYEVKDTAGAVVGYVVKTSTKGKGNDFVMMTGVTTQGTVCNLSVVSNNETAGYVPKVEKGGLFADLIGKDAKTQQAVGAVSAATKTSTAVKDGVALALKTVEEVQANG